MTKKIILFFGLLISCKKNHAFNLSSLPDIIEYGPTFSLGTLCEAIVLIETNFYTMSKKNNLPLLSYYLKDNPRILKGLRILQKCGYLQPSDFIYQAQIGAISAFISHMGKRYIIEGYVKYMNTLADALLTSYNRLTQEEKSRLVPKIEYYKKLNEKIARFCLTKSLVAGLCTSISYRILNQITH